MGSGWVGAERPAPQAPGRLPISTGKSRWPRCRPLRCIAARRKCRWSMEEPGGRVAWSSCGRSGEGRSLPLCVFASLRPSVASLPLCLLASLPPCLFTLRRCALAPFRLHVGKKLFPHLRITDLPDHPVGEVVMDVDEVKNQDRGDRKSTRLNSSHLVISYAVFC